MDQGHFSGACERAGVSEAVLGIATASGVESWCVGERRGTPVGVDSRFLTMSLIKGMTAAMVIETCRAHAVELDSPVVEHVGRLRLADGDDASAISIADLLAMTSGLPGWHLPFYGDDTREAADVVASFDGVELIHPPGTHFAYTNGAYVLAGALLERLDGTPFPEQLESFTTRMGLTKTAVLPGCRAVSPAGGGVTSTCRDLCRFALASTEPDWALMRQPRVAMPGPHEAAWGLGWCIYDWGCGAYGWDGVHPGARTYLRVLPAHDTAIVLLTNSNHGRAVYRTVVREVLAQRFGIEMSPDRYEPSTATPEPSFVGHYTNGDFKITIEPTATGHHLTGVTGGEENPPLLGGPLRPVDIATLAIDDPGADYPTVTLASDGFLTAHCFGWKRHTTN